MGYLYFRFGIYRLRIYPDSRQYAVLSGGYMAAAVNVLLNHYREYGLSDHATFYYLGNFTICPKEEWHMGRVEISPRPPTAVFYIIISVQGNMVLVWNTSPLEWLGFDILHYP